MTLELTPSTPGVLSSVGGMVERVTSEDESVTVTNPTGPTVDLSVESGGSSSVTLYKKTVAYTDIQPAAGGIGLAPLLTVAEGDVLIAAGAYVTTSFDDSDLTSVDGNIIDGDAVSSASLLGVFIDMTNQQSPITGYAGVGTAGTWVANVSGGFAVPGSPNAGLPFIGGPGGSPLSLYVAAWADDGNAGTMDFYLLVATPTVAP